MTASPATSSTLDRFNDAKKAEVLDRVKHGHL